MGQKRLVGGHDRVPVRERRRDPAKRLSPACPQVGVFPALQRASGVAGLTWGREQALPGSSTVASPQVGPPDLPDRGCLWAMALRRSTFFAKSPGSSAVRCPPSPSRGQ